MPSETGTADQAESGCAFILDGGGQGFPAAWCDAPRLSGSPYCAVHHRLCRLPGGGAGERRRLREIEALAEAVGGKRGRAAARPPGTLLRRLERVALLAARPRCSRIVRRLP